MRLMPGPCLEPFAQDEPPVRSRSWVIARASGHERHERGRFGHRNRPIPALIGLVAVGRKKNKVLRACPQFARRRRRSGQLLTDSGRACRRKKNNVPVLRSAAFVRRRIELRADFLPAAKHLATKDDEFSLSGLDVWRKKKDDGNGNR